MVQKEFKAKLRFIRLAPRKLRLVADAVRGKNIVEALRILKFSKKKGGKILEKLMKSAVANAQFVDEDLEDIENLFVYRIMVDEGPTVKRFRPRAMGRATRIRKRSSHINLILKEKIS